MRSSSRKLLYVLPLFCFGAFCFGALGHCEDKKLDHRGIHIGMAEEDITPPVGFPMAGYYHERLATGSLDPLKAKAIVFRGTGGTSAAIAVCDLVGVATDLSRAVRTRASERTGIPASNIVVAATHSHTAPDYMKELFLHLGEEKQDALRLSYIKKLIDAPVEAIARAVDDIQPATLRAGAAMQKSPVAFNRRFVMRDGSVRTWMNLQNPEVIRPAGPIDPEIGLLVIDDDRHAKPRGILSNFALHLDTVGGNKWSADYPFFIERSLGEAMRPEGISIFGTGCCGDINHSDPSRRERNKVDFIGNSLGSAILSQMEELQQVRADDLFVKTQTVRLPLRSITKQEVERSVEILKLAKSGAKVDFFDHVAAYRTVMLDHLRNQKPVSNTSEHITWGLSRSLAGIGEKIPVDVTVITIGRDVALVCLPGEIFVELGMSIKQASPFQTTLVVELANAVETIYVPHRAAYAGGSYEVTNSALQPGSGEILVETAIRLLREAATASQDPSR